MLNHEIQYLNISNPRLHDIQVKLTSPLPASTDSPGLVFGVGPCNNDNGGGVGYDAYMMMNDDGDDDQLSNWPSSQSSSWLPGWRLESALKYFPIQTSQQISLAWEQSSLWTWCC